MDLASEGQGRARRGRKQGAGLCGRPRAGRRRRRSSRSRHVTRQRSKPPEPGSNARPARPSSPRRSTSALPPPSRTGYAPTEARFGGIDALMTNSGGPPAGLALSFDDAAWQDAAELLLFSTLRMVRAAVPSMERRGGGAILVSTSSSVKEPIQNLGLSTVLRASVSALSKTLAIELAPSKIRVNQIIPGRIDTDRVRQLDEGNAKKLGVSVEEAKKRAIAAIPAGRYGEGRRVRTCRRLPVVGRRLVHDRRHRAGGRRRDPECPLTALGGELSAITPSSERSARVRSATGNW